jgi:hypothetical protein
VAAPQKPARAGVERQQPADRSGDGRHIESVR